jgi:subtilase family serine protease
MSSSKRSNSGIRPALDRVPAQLAVRCLCFVATTAWLVLFLTACAPSSSKGTGPHPDLIISALSTTPAVAPGDTLSLSNTVTNQGGVKAGSFTVAFHLSTNTTYGDGDDIAFTTTRSVSSLGVGVSNTASTTLTVPTTTPLGDYFICAKADDANTVAESDETNNTRCNNPLPIQVTLLQRWNGVNPGDSFGFFVLADNGGTPSDPRQDGVQDFIISEPCWSSCPSDGTVYVYSGIDRTLIFQINGTAFSYAVDAGDLNGDGVPDIFVGEMGANRAQVYSGWDGSPLAGLTFNSDGSGDGFGVSVSAIGDVTGDGIPDLLVGANGGNYVVLYSGKDGSRIGRIDNPDGANPTNFGMSVSEAGDVNGDGTPDFIVGAPGASPGGMSGAGSAFVFSGQRDTNGNFPILYRLNGEHAGDGFGGCCGAVDSVGDLNGDGRPELAVAAYLASPNGRAGAGSIYLFDGATGSPLQRPDGSGVMRLDGEAAGDRLGGSLCGCGWISKVGDIDGDGYADFMAGASGVDVNGSPDVGRVLIFSGFDASVLLRIDNPDTNLIPHYFGITGATLGDLDGNGQIEILIGAGELGAVGAYGSEKGSVYLYSLKTAAPIQVTGPDLVMADVTPNAGAVNAGATLSVTNTAQNQGAVSAGGSIIAFHLSVDNTYGNADDVVITTTRSVASLAAGASNTATTNLTIPSATPANTYYVCAMADSVNTVVETAEANNTLCSSWTVTVPPPDLIISALSTPTTAVAPGDTFSLSNTVMNQGGIQAGSFTMAFHLSTNTTYGDGDDVVITTTRSVSSLAAGASNAATTNLTIPSATPANTYYVCAMADSGVTVTEGDETNNTLCTATTIQVTNPDLVMTDVTPNAGTVNAGATLSVSNTVENTGAVSAGNFSIAFRLSPNTIYGDGDDVVITTARSVSSLAAGASNAATTNLTIPSTIPAGTYYVCAMADSGGTVIETNENNNTFCSSIQVTVPLPDLIISAISTSATTVAKGANFSLSNTVLNQGGSTAGSFVIAFHLSTNTTYGDGDDIAITQTRSVTSLGVGATNTVPTTTLTVPLTTPSGTYYVCALSDSTDIVVEGDETNNSSCTTSTITVP